MSPSVFRLLPLLYRNLEAHRVEDPDLPRLKGIYRHSWVINQRLAHRLGPAIAALEREGVSTMVLGGPAVGMAHYRDAGARRMDDAGVLVARSDAERAMSILQADGFSRTERIAPARVLRTGHALALVDPGGTRLRLQWGALPESIDDADFWSGGLAAGLGGAGTLTPGPTQQLLYTCVDGVRAGPDGLTWIADAALILRSAGKEIDWTRLVDGAARRGLALTTEVALMVLRDLIVEPIPDRVLDELGARPRTARERLLLRLSQRRVPGAGYARLWDGYRRQRTIAVGGHVHRDFLAFVADAEGLPSRRAVARQLVRRATSSVATLASSARPAQHDRAARGRDG